MASAVPERPNLLITMCDDQRHAALSCCDGPTADAVRTPHLDALAARGLRFRHAHHAGSPSGAICSPSRAMLHTGRGPFDIPAGMVSHGLGDAYDGPPDAPTLGQLLREQGYATYFVGKWHNDLPSFERSFDAASSVFIGGMDDHFNLPVQQYDGREFTPRHRTLGVHATDRFAASARGFLRGHASGPDADRPFLLVVAFTAPHDPRRTHEQWHRRYPIDAIELAPNFLPRHPFETGLESGRDDLLTPLPRDPDQTRREIADYYAMTEHMDHTVGQIHAELDELGLTDDTLVVHTADHGLAVGQHGLLGKQNMYDHSIRVPLLLAGPGVPADQTRDQLVYQHDLFPTLLDAAGADAPPRGAFASLWPSIRDASARPRDAIGCYYTRNQRAVRVGDRKLVAYHFGDEPMYQQFDLAQDPWERDTDPRRADEVDADLLDSLEAWRREMGDPLLGARDR